MKTRSAQELMRENLLVKHYAGSHAYGTALPTSDTDLRGIFCADPINLLTPFFPVREVEDNTEEDTKYYELAHFMKLCLDCNPNIIETLWVHQTDIVHTTLGYELLRSKRHELLSSKIAFTTSGYALSQLKRIKGHNKWINSPQPEEPPQAKDFVSLVQNFGAGKTLKFIPNEWNLGHRFVPFGGEMYGVYTSGKHQLFNAHGGLNTQFENEARETLTSPILLVKFNKEEYKLAKEKHSQYWTWKKNRNKIRSKLEEEHGIDTKHAMHLVRLLRMGLEALRDGEIIVKRPDAEELLSIRNGAWSYEEIIKYAEEMDNEVRNVWYKKTELPKKPNIKLAAKILMEVQEMIWDK